MLSVRNEMSRFLRCKHDHEQIRLRCEGEAPDGGVKTSTSIYQTRTQAIKCSVAVAGGQFYRLIGAASPAVPIIGVVESAA